MPFIRPLLLALLALPLTAIAQAGAFRVVDAQLREPY